MIIGSDAVKAILEFEFDGKAFAILQKELAKTGVELKKTGSDGQVSLSKIEDSADKAASAIKNLADEAASAGSALNDIGKKAESSGVKTEEGFTRLKSGLWVTKETAEKTAQKTKEVGEEAQKSGKGASGIRKLTEGFSDLKDAVTVAYNAVRKLISSAVEQRQIDAQQLVAIKNNTDMRSREGKSVKELAEEFKNYAQERQKLTGIESASTQKMQTMLLSMGTAPDLVNRVTDAVGSLINNLHMKFALSALDKSVALW